MSRIEKWKSIVEGGGLLTPNEAATLLLGDESGRIYQLREALNKMLVNGEKGNFLTYNEILMELEEVYVELPNGTTVGVLDLIESDGTLKRSPELTTILVDLLYYEKWLGD